MYNTMVGFTPLQNKENIKPPMDTEVHDSVWVKTPMNDPEQIIEAAKNKLAACYGGEYTNFIVYDGNQYLS